MAYYAFLNDDNIVTEVIEGVSETTLVDGESPEMWYGNFRGQICKQTSIDGLFRGTYAGIGYTYDAALDEFVAPPTPEPVPSA